MKDFDVNSSLQHSSKKSIAPTELKPANADAWGAPQPDPKAVGKFVFAQIGVKETKCGINIFASSSIYIYNNLILKQNNK
jgi:hypothetical protein